MTRILAIETSDAMASLAAAEGDRLLVEMELPADERSARSIAPGMIELLRRVGWRPQDVQLVAVSVGPGSFTGLRVGVTAGKTFAYAVGAEVVAVNTLEALVAGLPEGWTHAAAAVDAQRGDVAGQCFVGDDSGRPVALGPMRVLPVEKWLGELSPGTVVAGPAVGKRIDVGLLPPGVQLAASKFHRPRAALVATVGWRDYQSGRCDDLWTLLPVYSRRAAAEEKWDARCGGPTSPDATIGKIS